MPPRTRPTCAAEWVRRRSRWMPRQTAPRRPGWRATVAARLPSQHWPRRLVLITAVDAAYRCTGRVRPPQRNRPGRRLAASTTNGFGPFLSTASATTDTSTAATRAARTPTWQPDTGGCWCYHHSAADHGCRWTGAWISPPRSSTNCARRAAESRLFSQIVAPATYSTSMRWIRSTRPRAARGCYDQGRALADQLANFGFDSARPLGQGSLVRGVRGWWRWPGRRPRTWSGVRRGCRCRACGPRGGHQPRAGPASGWPRAMAPPL